MGAHGDALRTETMRHQLDTVRFFNKMHHTISDILCFVKNFLDGHLLIKCSEYAGINKATAVYWAQYIRDLFVQWVWEEVIIKELKFEGIFKVGESLFGRKIKYHRGNCCGQERIWVVGLVERSSGGSIYYPVANRSAVTLTKIIQRHIVPGSTIYTDGQVGYHNLNNLGYRHFSVIHTESSVVSKNFTGTLNLVI